MNVYQVHCKECSQYTLFFRRSAVLHRCQCRPTSKTSCRLIFMEIGKTSASQAASAIGANLWTQELRQMSVGSLTAMSHCFCHRALVFPSVDLTRLVLDLNLVACTERNSSRSNADCDLLCINVHCLFELNITL